MRARFYRGPAFDVNNPKNLPKSVVAPVNDTEDEENQLADDDPGAEEGKKKNKSKNLTEAEQERHATIHESAHAAVITVLGGVIDEISFDRWTGCGVVRGGFSNLSLPDRVTCLVSGGVGERMAGSKHPDCDRDDMIEARQLASDEQIARAKARAAEILQANWHGVAAVADALQRSPYLKGSVVRALLEAVRKAPVVHRTDEDIITAEFEVRRTRGGMMKRIGVVRCVAGHWYGFRDRDDKVVGRFNNHLDAARAI
jgi:hypothetical protein